MVYLHISDLHLGLCQPPHLDAPLPRFGKWLKWLKGQWGHHYLALQRLAEFYEQLVKQEKHVQVILSGDATAFGKPDEFNNAHNFITAQLHGVGMGARNYASIPGNHDHWPGSGRIVGRPTIGLSKYFPPPRAPSWVGLLPAVQPFRLTLIQINTDADVYSYSRGRVMARGKFHNQIAFLDRHLPPKAADEKRILLLHHSMLLDRPHYKAPLSIKHRSAGALEQAIVRHGIGVLMCGHTHALADVISFTAAAPNLAKQGVIECRCGTTTQRDQIPSHYRTPTGQWPAWPLDQNSLLVHRFEVDHGNLVIVSQAFVLTNIGFTPYGGLKRNIVN
jgi:hypothetical protein